MVNDDHFANAHQSETSDINLNVAVVIVNYRTAQLVSDCLASISSEREHLPCLQVVIVDGGSDDDSVVQLNEIAQRPEFCTWVRILPLAINGGFGWANNQAMLRLLQQNDPPNYIHLLNPDTRIQPAAIVELARFLHRHGDVGAVGSQLLNVEGQLEGSAFRFHTIGHEFARGARTGFIAKVLGIPDLHLPTSAVPRRVDWVTGASLMLRTAALREVGLFDDGFFLYHEEVELMWRLRRHLWSVWHVPTSSVVHIGGAATGVSCSVQLGGLSPKLPDYWYESRRRLLALLYGRAATFGAGLLWLFGHAIWRLRRMFGLTRKANLGVAQEFSDNVRLFLRPRASDKTWSAPRWDTPPGDPPAWKDF